MLEFKGNFIFKAKIKKFLVLDIKVLFFSKNLNFIPSPVLSAVTIVSTIVGKNFVYYFVYSQYNFIFIRCIYTCMHTPLKRVENITGQQQQRNKTEN